MKFYLLGDKKVGKSSLISRFVDDEFSIDIRPTVGTQFYSGNIEVEDKIIRTQLWTSWHRREWYIENFAGSVAAIVVFDLSKKATFDNVSTWLERIKDYKVPIILVGNKGDLNFLREVPYEMAAAFAEMHGLLYIEASALDGRNVEKIFEYAVKEACKANKLELVEETDTSEKTGTSLITSLGNKWLSDVLQEILNNFPENNKKKNKIIAAINDINTDGHPHDFEEKLTGAIQDKGSDLYKSLNYHRKGPLSFFTAGGSLIISKKTKSLLKVEAVLDKVALSPG
ncbi:GTP-binding protein [Legionella spiritensis]|uniref:GTP-binding protein n=1 Tax=Legionella spiritensis TaxID=452 RepID=UPI000F718AC7|nr:GTP-binding protein [Legionella spiritensis]VEG90127.1 Ras family GTPase [Legionella spiritensis]